MPGDMLQQAIDHLSIADVYLVASEARHLEDFNPKDAHALEGLTVQTMHVARRSQVLETEITDQFLVRIVLGFGVRWVKEPGDEEAEAEAEAEADVQAFVEADYVAEYVMNQRLEQEAIDAFALKNASYHVWPYWREYLMSQCERLRMPRLILPLKQFPDNGEQ